MVKWLGRAALVALVASAGVLAVGCSDESDTHGPMGSQRLMTMIDGSYHNGNDNGGTNGNDNGGTNGNDNGGTNGNDNGGTNGNDNGGTNGNDNGGTNGNDNGGTNGNDNGGTNGNDNGGTNGNDNGGTNGNDNGGTNGNDNGGTNGNDNGGTNGNDNGGTNGNDNGGTNGNDNGGTNGNDNGGTNGNDNGGTGGTCPDGSTQLSSVLSGGSDNEARYRLFTVDCGDFRVRVRDMASFTTYTVYVSGVSVGSLSTDDRGRGELDYDQLPSDFPAVDMGDTITVGPASGSFSVDCSSNSNCNG